MAIKVQDAGTLRDITGIQVKQAGVLRTIKSVQVMDGGTLRLVWARNLAVTTSPTFIYEQGFQSSFASSPVTAIPSGGFPPYTYSWTIGPSTGTPSSAYSPTAATTRFSKASVPIDTVQLDSWQVTVTDSVGQSASTTINASFHNMTTAGHGGL